MSEENSGEEVLKTKTHILQGQPLDVAVGKNHFKVEGQGHSLAFNNVTGEINETRPDTLLTFPTTKAASQEKHIVRSNVTVGKDYFIVKDKKGNGVRFNNTTQEFKEIKHEDISEK